MRKMRRPTTFGLAVSGCLFTLACGGGSFSSDAVGGASGGGAGIGNGGTSSGGSATGGRGSGGTTVTGAPIPLETYATSVVQALCPPLTGCCAGLQVPVTADQCQTTFISTASGYEIGNHDSYQNTVDGRCYRHYVAERKDNATDVRTTLARRLHDHAISDAVQEYLAGKKVVAIMGGHNLGRNVPMYLEIARLARDLANAGLLPASGGGPGAMEATHLGAWFAERDDAELQDAVAILSKAPKYDPIGPWLDTAFEVAEKYPVTSTNKCDSLGIPTWLYGHEPPTPFALHIAKYFANSVREDGLLAIARYGVVFSPGSAGTVQEIFQDATQNHYKTQGIASPMIFLGKQYWQETKPVYPLLVKLAEGQEYSRLLGIEDDRTAILKHIVSFAKALDSTW